MTYWGLVHTIAGREDVAERNLPRQGFTCFTPRTRRTIRHARRVRRELRALFPSYLFLEIDPDVTAWRSANKTVGVVRVVCDGTAPSRAPSGLVEELMQALDDGGAVDLRPGGRPGERVRVVDGPFAERIGVIERLSGRDRVRVLLDLMGGARAVDAPLSALRRTG